MGLLLQKSSNPGNYSSMNTNNVELLHQFQVQNPVKRFLKIELNYIHNFSNIYCGRPLIQILMHRGYCGIPFFGTHVDPGRWVSECSSRWATTSFFKKKSNNRANKEVMLTGLKLSALEFGGFHYNECSHLLRTSVLMKLRLLNVLQ